MDWRTCNLFSRGRELWICLFLSPLNFRLMTSGGVSIWPQPLVCWSDDGNVFTKDLLSSCSLLMAGETDQTSGTTSVRELQSYQPIAPINSQLQPMRTWLSWWSEAVLSTCQGNYRLWHEPTHLSPLTSGYWIQRDCKRSVNQPFNKTQSPATCDI